MSNPSKEKEPEVEIIDPGDNINDIKQSSTNQGWTLHEPSARSRTKHTKSTEAPTNAAPNAATTKDRYEIVNLRHFSKFQERIYHIVHSIVHKT